MLDRLRVWASRIRGLLTRRRLDDDFRQELDAHLALLTEENIRRGMTPEEARRAARVRLGGVTQLREAHREAWGWPMLETLVQDVCYGLRQLRRSPGFTLVAVLTLALGIGANTAIFSVVYGIILRPLPYRDAGRLAVVWTHRAEKPDSRYPVSLPDFKDWETQNSVFDRLAAFATNRYDVHGLEGGEGMRAALVTPGFFPLLGVKPVLGRELGPADDRQRVAVIGYDVWQRLYHGDRDAIGKTLRLSEHDYTVVGVMPPEFSVPPTIELWLSFADLYAFSSHAGVANWLSDRRLRGLIVLGRLKKGVSLAHAQSQMNTIEQRLAASYPEDDRGIGIALVPWRTQLVGDVEGALFLLLGAVGFVLLIACVNVANFMLARATVREREMAIRRALGASRGRLVRQTITEAVLLGACGGTAGLLIAFWGLDAFLGLAPRGIPRLQDVHLNGPVLLFAFVSAMGSSLFFGVTAALRGTGHQPNDALREGGRGVGEHARGRKLRASLVSGEIALAAMLLTGAGLMLSSFVRLATLNPGFPTGHLLTFDVIASLDRYRSQQEQTEFFNQVLVRIRALPGVVAAGACTSMPPDISQEMDPFEIAGETPAERAKRPEAWYLPATPGFVSALGLPLIEGRDFSDADTARSPRVAIVNQELVRQYFGHANPLGQEIRFHKAQRTIVGVVGNTTYSGLGAPAGFQIYVPYAQGAFPGLHFAVRTSSAQPFSELAAVRAGVHAVDRQANPERIFTMDQLLSSSIVQPRFYTSLLVAFGLVGLALAAVGVFGLVSYSVTQRTHEIGIRVALGAQRGDILYLVIGQGLRLTLIGVVSGIAGALGLTRFLSSLLYGVKPTDPATYGFVAAILVVIALLACYIPARRATRVDPMVALRCE